MRWDGEPMGDTLFMIAIGIIAFSFIFGWALLPFAILSGQFPRLKWLNATVDFICTAMDWIQKKAWWAVAILFALKLISSLLGWGPPIDFTDE